MTAYHSLETKTLARRMRASGKSMGEIAILLDLPHGTIRSWVYQVQVDESGMKRLQQRAIQNRQEALRVQKEKRAKQYDQLKGKIRQEIAHEFVAASKVQKKIWCALLFWAEGSKSGSSLVFTNSDPVMIRCFLQLLRSAFLIDESKFRVLLHIHEYHNDVEQRLFWSKETDIPLEQFNRSYRKPNTGKNKREGYMGAASIRYYDTRIAQELTELYNTLAVTLRGVG